MIQSPVPSAPRNHGEVVVWPAAHELAAAARDQWAGLASLNGTLAGRPLREWRRWTRQTLLGQADRPLVVTGHQPGFIHAGVWAKHVVAARLASAIEGQALHLVVDSDEARDTRLRIPLLREGRIEITHAPFGPRAAHAYEQLPALTEQELFSSAHLVSNAMGQRFRDSLMPEYLAALRESKAPCAVEQLMAGQRAVEEALGVSLCYQRVSRIPWGPLLAEVVGRPEAFANAYNDALDEFRLRHRVRAPGHPVPRLSLADGRLELPIWAWREGQARRRFFVSVNGPHCTLWAEREKIAEVPKPGLESWLVTGAVEDVQGWKIRPRALLLTLWARILLADVFIHGIGGAKYDPITDLIIEKYFGMSPPRFACVSATLHLDLPRPADGPKEIQRLRTALRDLQWNPQRNVQPGTDLEPWLDRRGEAVRRCLSLRELAPKDRRGRHEAFLAIREASAAIAALRPQSQLELRAKLDAAESNLDQYRLATDREYFFALFPRSRLEVLLSALPGVDAFRV